MEFLDALLKILAVVETAALIGALIFATRAIKEEKKSEAKKSMLRTSMLYFLVYILLNFLRNFVF